MTVTCACCGASVEWWVRLRSHPDIPICHDCVSGLDAQRDGQLQLMSGTWLALGAEPVFTVADVRRSARFYEDLGFETSLHDETYALAHRDRGLTIHLAQAEDGAACGHGSVYIHCQDADRVAEDWRRAGVAVTGPADQDHGRREGTVADPDGNVLRFGSPLR